MRAFRVRQHGKCPQLDSRWSAERPPTGSHSARGPEMSLGEPDGGFKDILFTLISVLLVLSCPSGIPGVRLMSFRKNRICPCVNVLLGKDILFPVVWSLQPR